MTAAARIDPPSAAAKAAVDDMRVEWIGETADLAIPFLIGAREAARNGDTAKLGACLGALWLATQTMRKAYHEIGGGKLTAAGKFQDRPDVGTIQRGDPEPGA